MANRLASSGEPTAERIGLGIGLVCLSSLTFAVMFACVKFLDGRYSPLQVILLRNAIGLAVSMPVLWRAGRTVWVTDRPFAHGLRAMYGLLSTVLVFYAVTQLPLATVTAVTFTMPLFLTMLSMPLLGERVGIRRTTATLVGFAGVLIILDPGGEINIAAMAALASALFYALVVIAVRQLSVSEPAIRIFFYYTLANVLVCGAGMPWVWVTPDTIDWLVFLFIGTIGAAAQYCFVSAYRYAPASVIAPFDYSQILFALMVGYLVWGELPKTWSFVGGGIIVASGLYIWWRERRLAARKLNEQAKKP